MSEWKEYTGSDEQLAELIKAENGLLIKLNTMIGRDKSRMVDSYDELVDLGYENFVTHYLICSPHPLADMICQQARTGQPVYIQGAKESENGLQMEWFSIKTTKPNWYLNTEYSFTPFEEEV